MSKYIEWPDLESHGAEMSSVIFEDSDAPLIMISFHDVVPLDTFTSLKKAGFIRLGDNFFFPNAEISHDILQNIFGDIGTNQRDVAQTHVRIMASIPDILIRALNITSPEVETPFDAVNHFQVKYKSASNSGEPISVIPKPLAFGTQEALQRLQDAHGDVDQWVLQELQYESLEKMYSVLSPEQIDAVALTIDNAINGSGSICADQTGLGKGRVGAALLRWTTLQGKLFVFLTEKANLFTDFIRDVVDIDSMDIVGTPYLMNDGAKILDQATGQVMFKSLPASKNKEVIKNRDLPAGTNLVMATYSQLNRQGSDKSEFFKQICEGAHLHADESHNAAGEESNTSIAVENAMSVAERYSYSSATHAKRASNMRIYKPLLPQSIAQLDNMVEILQAGGVPLMEALSQALARTGRLVRREHDLSDMKIPVIIDEQRRQYHNELSDALAPILSRVSRLSMDISKHLEEKSNTPEAKKKKEIFYSVHWGTRLSMVVKQFIAACKVDHCVDQAVAALLRDQKPTIVVQNTMEAVMKELMQGEDGLQPYLIDPDGTQRVPGFKDILTLMVDRSMTAKKRVGKEESESIEIDEEEFVAAAEEIKELIQGFPDLPLSPMDAVIDGIEKEGRRLAHAGKIEKPWSVSEISARSLRLDPENGVVPMEPVDRNSVIHGFQQGVYDCLLLTKAASTGLSLHENPRAKDRRVRHMIEFQIPPNPVDRIQFWGRVKRRGGTKEPEFSCLATGLSIELRELAAQNRKVAELSANVSGSSTSAVMLDVPDPINSLGNKVARKVLEENPMTARKMGISLQVEEEEGAEELYYVNKFLSRLALLQSSERDTLYDVFMEAYQDALNDMLSKGLHPTRPRELPGKWRVKDREIFEAGNPGDGPVFGAPVYLTTIEQEVYTYPLGRADVIDLVSQKGELFKQGEEIRERVKAFLTDNHGEFLKAVLPARYKSVIAAYNAKENNMVKVEAEKIATIQKALKNAAPGVEVALSNDFGETTYGLVTGLRVPENQEDWNKPGRFNLEIILPGDENVRQVSLATLSNDEKFKFCPRNNDEAHDKYARFDGWPAGRSLVERKILDGNAFMASKFAVQRQVGKTTLINMEEGDQISAVLIPKSQHDLIQTFPGSTSDVDVAFDILHSGGDLYTDFSNMLEGMRISRDGPMIKVTIPGKKSLAKKFKIPEIEKITGEFSGNFREMSAKIKPDQFFDLHEVLSAKGIQMTFAGSWRKHALRAAEEKKEEKACPAA